MPASEYEDDEVEELCDTIEEILEEDGKCDNNTIIMGDRNSVVGGKAHHNILDYMDWEGGIREVKCLLTSVKEMDLL
jgi:hypothetical protein